MIQEEPFNVHIINIKNDIIVKYNLQMTLLLIMQFKVVFKNADI